jgi:hypothetical protein
MHQPPQVNLLVRSTGEDPVSGQLLFRIVC